MTCKHCNGRQYSESDKKYLEIYGRCWSCDKRDWETGKLTLAEFENREANAVKQAASEIRS
jgi:hypothetical protein